MSRCSNIPANCRFLRIGCTTTGKEAQLTKHYADRAVFHVELLEQKVADLEQSLLQRIMDLENLK
jgi:hypothetical protein